MVPHRAPHANDVLRNLLREEKKNQENKNAFRNVLLLLPQSHIYIFFFTRNLSLTQKAGTNEDLAAHTSGASLSLEQEIGLFYELDWAQEDSCPYSLICLSQLHFLPVSFNFSCQRDK